MGANGIQQANQITKIKIHMNEFWDNFFCNFL
jgi:hypothetical protein